MAALVLGILSRGDTVEGLGDGFHAPPTVEGVAADAVEGVPIGRVTQDGSEGRGARVHQGVPSEPAANHPGKPGIVVALSVDGEHDRAQVGLEHVALVGVDDHWVSSFG